ncbi:MAG: hypothetical protein LUE23_01265 [Lachnospiraceae bacterium]|nr:hypothetical protein [Lachnospiraceae bacterium]
MKKEKKKRSRRQTAALIAIVLLLCMYLINLILALIGTEESRDLLKITLTCSIAAPILLFGLLVALQKTSRFRQNPEEELTPEQREEARRMMREAEETHKEKNSRKKSDHSAPGKNINHDITKS